MSQIFDKLRKTGRVYPHMMADPVKLAEFVLEARKQNPHWTEGDHRAVQYEYAFAHKWMTSGEIVYSLSHSLAALFAMTSAPHIDWDHLPHPAFVIQIPRAFLPLRGTLEPEHSYVYVSKHQTLTVPDYDTCGQVTGYGTMSSTELEKLNPKRLAKDCADFDLSPEDREQTRIAFTEKIKSVPYFAGASDEIIEAMVQFGIEKEIEHIRKMGASMPSMSPLTQGTYILVNRLVANTLAYVHESKSGTVARRATADQAGTLVNLLPPHDVVVHRAMRDAAKDVIAAMQSGSVVGIRRVMAHHVRGHWRDQPYGTGRTQRRQKWIHPHERGSQDLGSVVRRIETLNVPGSTQSN